MPNRLTFADNRSNNRFLVGCAVGYYWLKQITPETQPTMATWQCVKKCGACCQLDPADRPDLGDYLSPEELSTYMSLVGEDGWCTNYDKDKRECTVYDTRPNFCRVEPDTFQKLYDIAPTELNDFAIECCEQQISGIYGNRSPEMDRFYDAIGLENVVIEINGEAEPD